MKRRVATVGLGVAAALALAAPAPAATPDGSGPWADTVVAFEQELRKDGTPVLPARSDPTDALGVAEDTAVEGTFVSLGFGGSITLGFDNNICNLPGPDVAIRLFETTREPYPDERVDVYVSADGVTYVLAASDANKDAAIDLPDSVNIARYVKLVDVTDPTPNLGNADAYDVDGVRALNTNCVGAGRMTGGGSHVVAGAVGKVTHGFTLRCELADGPDQLTVKWKPVGARRAATFKLGALTSALCSDDPAIGPAPPAAPFDTFTGRGTGTVDGVPGYQIDFRFSDAGEPGRRDASSFVITRPSTAQTLLDVPLTLLGGNHQAHHQQP